MQRVSLVFNFILLIAVIYLFVKVNSLSSASAETSVSGGTTKDTNRIIPDDGQLKIAFIVADSLNTYEWYIDRKAELAQEEKNVKATLEAELKKAQRREKEIQNDFKFMKLSEQEAAQKELMGLQQKLSSMEQNLLGALQEKELNYNKQLYENVNNFVSDYAKENNLDYVMSYTPGGPVLFCNPAFDITSDIVSGLNKEYKEYKSKQK